MDGLDVCKELVNKFDIPIIISSARSDITDKVTALKLGADDYLPNLMIRELEVCIRTILRRFNKSIQIDELKYQKKTFLLNEEKKKRDYKR